jgi:fluoride exporter
MKGIEFVFLALGAVAGAFLRYKIASASPILLGELPANILIVNVIGSFVLGVFYVITFMWNLDAKYSLLVAIGFCGSLTTISSFALETNNLIDNRQVYYVALNIGANVGLSLGALTAGKYLTIILTKIVGGFDKSLCE